MFSAARLKARIAPSVAVAMMATLELGSSALCVIVANLPSRDLFGPDAKAFEDVRSESGRYGDVGGVAPAGD